MSRRLEFLETAMSQFGVMEIKGKVDNPEILKYFDELGFDGSQLKDETAWCSAFANWCAKKCDLDYTGKLNARSWLDAGIATHEPRPGDLVVLWREDPKSWKGHVGIFVNEDKNHVYVLGGNQSNMVNIAAYDKRRVLSYRSIA